MESIYWASNKKRKITKRSKKEEPENDDEDDNPFVLPFKLPSLGGGSTLYTNANHIYFNNEINHFKSIFYPLISRYPEQNLSRC